MDKPENVNREDVDYIDYEDLTATAEKALDLLQDNGDIEHAKHNDMTFPADELSAAITAIMGFKAALETKL